MAGLPANIRIYAETLLGERSPITEQDFSEDELQVMIRAVDDLQRWQQQSQAQPGPFRDRLDFYLDNPKGFEAAFSNSLVGQLVESFRNPELSVLLSLGQARLEVDSEGNRIIRDRYDFAPVEGRTLMEKLRYDRQRGGLIGLGRMLAPEGREVRIDLGPQTTIGPR